MRLYKDNLNDCTAQNSKYPGAAQCVEVDRRNYATKRRQMGASWPCNCLSLFVGKFLCHLKPSSTFHFVKSDSLGHSHFLAAIHHAIGNLTERRTGNSNNGTR